MPTPEERRGGGKASDCKGLAPESNEDDAGGCGLNEVGMVKVKDAEELDGPASPRLDPDGPDGN